MKAALESPQTVKRWSFEPFFGAFVATLQPSGLRLETWGTERVGLAIESRRYDRAWLRFDTRDGAWTALSNAFRTGQPYHARHDEVLLRKGRALDRLVPCDVTVGRSAEGGILVSIRPIKLDAPIDGYAVTIDADDAHRFANAMDLETPDARREYALKIEELRTTHV